MNTSPLQNQPYPYNYQSLLADLENFNGLTRQRARLALEDIGTLCVPDLIRKLSCTNSHARWEAAKALAAIPDSRAAEALVNTLEDEDISVRWAAADALIALDRVALEPLLRALTKDFSSIWLREGAHHVLHQLKKRNFLTPTESKVFEALEHLAPEMEVPWAAERALEELIRSYH
jgi:HEAT repeat protein